MCVPKGCFRPTDCVGGWVPCPKCSPPAYACMVSVPCQQWCAPRVRSARQLNVMKRKSKAERKSKNIIQCIASVHVSVVLFIPVVTPLGVRCWAYLAAR